MHRRFRKLNSKLLKGQGINHCPLHRDLYARLVRERERNIRYPGQIYFIILSVNRSVHSNTSILAAPFLYLGAGPIL